jgi:uncharacterized membrane protein
MIIMKFLGHPIHVMLIHFPTALLPMDLLLSYLFYTGGNESFGTAAFYCLTAGVALGLVAGVTGLIDLVGIKEKTAMAAALVHGGINLTAILIFSVFAYRGWKQFPSVPAPSAVTLIIKLLTVIFIFVGNYLGGRLIFKHHIAIEP